MNMLRINSPSVHFDTEESAGIDEGPLVTHLLAHPNMSHQSRDGLYATPPASPPPTATATADSDTVNQSDPPLLNHLQAPAAHDQHVLHSQAHLSVLMAALRRHSNMHSIAHIRSICEDHISALRMSVLDCDGAPLVPLDHVRVHMATATDQSLFSKDYAALAACILLKNIIRNDGSDYIQFRSDSEDSVLMLSRLHSDSLFIPVDTMGLSRIAYPLPPCRCLACCSSLTPGISIALSLESQTTNLEKLQEYHLDWMLNLHKQDYHNQRARRLNVWEDRFRDADSVWRNEYYEHEHGLDGDVVGDCPRCNCNVATRNGDEDGKEEEGEDSDNGQDEDGHEEQDFTGNTEGYQSTDYPQLLLNRVRDILHSRTENEPLSSDPRRFGILLDDIYPQEQEPILEDSDEALERNNLTTCALQESLDAAAFESRFLDAYALQILQLFGWLDVSLQLQNEPIMGR